MPEVAGVTILDRISREPVLAFGAIGLSITAWAPSWVDNDAKKAAVAGILLFAQRAFSTSKKSADEIVATVTADKDHAIEVGKYIGAVESQATTAAATIIARTTRSGSVTPAPPAAPAPHAPPPGA